MVFYDSVWSNRWPPLRQQIHALLLTNLGGWRLRDYFFTEASVTGGNCRAARWSLNFFLITALQEESLGKESGISLHLTNIESSEWSWKAGVSTFFSLFPIFNGYSACFSLLILTVQMSLIYWWRGREIQLFLEAVPARDSLVKKIRNTIRVLHHSTPTQTSLHNQAGTNPPFVLFPPWCCSPAKWTSKHRANSFYLFFLTLCIY